MKNSKWKLTQRVASNIIVVFAGVAFFLALSNFDAVKEQLASWAVSYTHLDVYKRQGVLTRVSRRESAQATV